jgi:hypothetical protein
MPRLKQRKEIVRGLEDEKSRLEIQVSLNVGRKRGYGAPQ